MRMIAASYGSRIVWLGGLLLLGDASQSFAGYLPPVNGASHTVFFEMWNEEVFANGSATPSDCGMSRGTSVPTATVPHSEAPEFPFIFAARNALFALANRNQSGGAAGSSSPGVDGSGPACALSATAVSLPPPVVRRVGIILSDDRGNQPVASRLFRPPRSDAFALQ